MNKHLDSLLLEYHGRGIPHHDLEQLKEISGNDPALFQRYAHRRLFHEPLAYIAGKATFFERAFSVDCRVYLPNKETEQLVQLMLAELDSNKNVVDVGTGCGNIAITLKKERPNVQIYGADISPAALEVARSNALKHHADIQFFESRYTDDLPELKPNIIVSDMPYGDKHYTLPSIDLREFDHMPPQALFDARGPLESYKELIHSIQQRGWHPILYIETGRVEKDIVKEIVPLGVSWEYLPREGYSITRMQL